MSVRAKEIALSNEAYVAAFTAFRILGIIEYHRASRRFLLYALALLDVAETGPPSRGLATAIAGLGAVFDAIGASKIARRLHGKASIVAEAISDDVAKADVRLIKGLHEHGAGVWHVALQSFSASADLYGKAGLMRYCSGALSCRYMLLLSMGDPSWMEELDKAIDSAIVAQDEHAIAQNLAGAAIRHCYRGEFDAALPLFEKACAAYERLPDFRYLPVALAPWGSCLAKLGRGKEAMVILDRARRAFESHVIRGVHASVYYTGLAEGYLEIVERTGDSCCREEALRHARIACSNASQQGRRMRDESGPEAQRLNGVLSWIDGDKRRARKLWERGIRAANVLGAMRVLARIHYQLAQRFDDADHRSVAESLFKRCGGAPM